MLNDKKLYEYEKIKYKDKNLEYYIINYYFNDIFKCFFNSMKIINKNINNNIKPMCCVIDLDETFFQNDSFLFNTLDIWKYNKNLYEYYKSIKQPFGPILPFMFILYEYLIYKNIHIIFLSGRHIKYKQQTIDNLIFFNVNKFELILNDTKLESKIYKQNNINEISKKYNIILCINDQKEFKHENLVMSPSLYIID